MNLLKASDLDGSGTIDYTEFITATMNAQVFMRDEYLMTAFQMFDKDGSGKIDREEIIQLLQGDDMQNLVPQEELNRYIDEIDENGDGEIDFEEFQ